MKMYYSNKRKRCGKHSPELRRRQLAAKRKLLPIIAASRTGYAVPEGYGEVTMNGLSVIA